MSHGAGVARMRGAAAIGLAAVVVTALAGCFPTTPAAAKTPSPSPTTTALATPTPTPTPEVTTPPPPPPDPAQSHLATPEPDPRPAPVLIPVPAGTVVAQGDVASPKGSIHYHYKVVASGANTYNVQYSGFTSTVPVPISATLLVIPPRVGDGLTWHGVGDHGLGGPTTEPLNATASIPIGQPGYLTTLVTYSSVASGAGVPIELGPNKVLAVTPLQWSIPVRQTNVHPADSGARSYAAGKVTAKTASGAPKRYLVAPDDITSVVAQRFGISVADLIWMNQGLQVFGAQQYLYSGTTLNLDPDSL